MPGEIEIQETSMLPHTMDLRFPSPIDFSEEAVLMDGDYLTSDDFLFKLLLAGELLESSGLYSAPKLPPSTSTHPIIIQAEQESRLLKRTQHSINLRETLSNENQPKETCESSENGKVTKRRGIVREEAFKKFRAKVKVNQKVWYLGLFDNEDDGAEAYDIACIFLNRLDTLNFPEKDYKSRFPRSVPDWVEELVKQRPSSERSWMANEYLSRQANQGFKRTRRSD